MKILYLIATLLILIGIGLPIATTYAQQADQAYLIRSFDLGHPELIDIKTSGGSIQVKGSDREDVRVEMYVRQNNRYLDDSDTSLDDFRIEIEQDGSIVRAHASRESGSGWRLFRGGSNISISFIVYSPRETGVDVNTSGGSVSAENLEGQIQLRTSGGSVTMQSLKGMVNAKTSGGSISFEDIEGELNAGTSGGSIRASNSNGKLDLRTSGGSIRLDQVGGSVTARTSGGSISAKIHHVGEQVDLQTSGGSISIDIPGLTGYELDLSGTRVQTELRNFSGEVERNRIKGVINNGGPLIKARTSGGTVRINYL